MRDCEKVRLLSVFLCQPETFGILQLQDRDFKVLTQGSKMFSWHSRLCK